MPQVSSNHKVAHSSFRNKLKDNCLTRMLLPEGDPQQACQLQLAGKMPAAKNCEHCHTLGWTLIGSLLKLGSPEHLHHTLHSNDVTPILLPEACRPAMDDGSYSILLSPSSSTRQKRLATNTPATCGAQQACIKDGSRNTRCGKHCPRCWWRSVPPMIDE